MFEAISNMLGWSNPTRFPPVIGISGGNADSASVRAMMVQIQSAGATPIFLGNHAQRDAKSDIAKIDALIVMGNNADIDPEKYGEDKNSPAHAHTKPESATPEGKARADYEYALMHEALVMGMPMLGVCGGMQRLNVLCGGTLNPHVPDLTGNDDHAQQDHNIAPFIPVQLVRIEPGSTLSDISREVAAVYTPAHQKAPLSHIMENSMHHQSVNKVGEYLRVAGHSDEHDKEGKPIRIIEAIEADPNGAFGQQFLVGVQWHPEFSASPLGKYLSERVVHEAATYAKQHSRTHPVQEAIDENILSAAPMMKAGPNSKVAVGGFTQHLLERRQNNLGLSA